LTSLSGWSSVDTGCFSNKTSSTSSNQISGALNKEKKKKKKLLIEKVNI